MLSASTVTYSTLVDACQGAELCSRVGSIRSSRIPTIVDSSRAPAAKVSLIVIIPPSSHTAAFPPSIWPILCEATRAQTLQRDQSPASRPLATWTKRTKSLTLRSTALDNEGGAAKSPNKIITLRSHKHL